MSPYVLFFGEMDSSSLPYAGGKGANLGEMTQAGFPVPGGFCITTNAYKDFIGTSRQMSNYFAALDELEAADLTRLRKVGEEIRAHLQQLTVPAAISNEIVNAWLRQGPAAFYAVRSSATAEDLPGASFAGQQDTYLNIKGQEELLNHVVKCWASLFTDRAIAYRAKNGFDHREVYLAVVVQQMVIPDVSGIMFTADPITGNRNVTSIDAGFGLGEALVSGLVSADLYKVKDCRIIHKQVKKKKLAIYSLPDGGTVTEELTADQQEQQALTDRQIIDMATLGKKIEHHYGAPQDIEFCVANEQFFIVQSRPITTLYPLPDIPREPVRALLSFGHAQMMVDAIKPLGISVIRAVFPARMFVEAGGRLFLDLTDILHYKLGRLILPKLLSIGDEAMSRALDAVVKRPEFLEGYQAEQSLSSIRKAVAPVMKKVWENIRNGQPEQFKSIVEDFMEEKIEETGQTLHRVQGAKRILVVQQQLDGVIQVIFQQIIPYVISGFVANALLKKILARHLGDLTEFNKLNMSLPGNVTSEMGLKLGDLADLLREFPEVQQYLKTASDRGFYEGLARVRGGSTFQAAFETFIEHYGMRCPGEIDITTPRWREAPTKLIAAFFSHMQSVRVGEHRERFSLGEKKAAEASQYIVSQMRGNLKKRLVSRLLRLFRYAGGLREHHKFLLITVMDECKQAIMAEADKLVSAGVLRQRDDVYYFRLEELRQILQGDFTNDIAAVLAERKEQYLRYQGLKPPRVMTSEGEIVIVPPGKGKIPAGALGGSGVSAGVAEGIARVILKPENASLKTGEILVAPQTDPGWTPLFQSAVAIVTEVGGLMTHGAVVAREYGIPAVVGVDEATTLIKDGDKIRVDGDQGIVEIVS